MRARKKKEEPAVWCVWLLHDGAGWWLHEDELEAAEASEVLRRAMKANQDGNVIGGAVLQTGQQKLLLRLP